MKYYKLLLLLLFIPLISCGEDEPAQIDDSKAEEEKVIPPSSIEGTFSVYFTEHPYYEGYERPNNCRIWINTHHLGEPYEVLSILGTNYEWHKVYDNAKFADRLKEAVEFVDLTNEGAYYTSFVLHSDFDMHVNPEQRITDLGGKDKWKVTFHHSTLEQKGFTFPTSGLDSWKSEHASQMEYYVDNAGEEHWSVTITDFDEQYIIKEIIPYVAMNAANYKTNSFDYYDVSVYANKASYSLAFTKSLKSIE